GRGASTPRSHVAPAGRAGRPPASLPRALTSDTGQDPSGPSQQLAMANRAPGGAAFGMQQGAGCETSSVASERSARAQRARDRADALEIERKDAPVTVIA